MRFALVLLAALTVVPALAQDSTRTDSVQPEQFAGPDQKPELIGGLDALMTRVVYPQSALRDGVEGRVYVQFLVTVEGRPTQTVCVRSPDDRLCEAARIAVLDSRFTPAVTRGEPVPVRFTLPVSFILADAPPEASGDHIGPQPLGPPEDIVGADGVYNAVQEVPTLIGGLEALQRRVRYPKKASRAGIQGTIFVQFVVNEQGEVTNPFCVRSSHDLLCEAALDAVRPARFTPGLQDGAPVKVRFTLPISFRLR